MMPDELQSKFAKMLDGDMDPKMREVAELALKGLTGDVAAMDAAMLSAADLPDFSTPATDVAPSQTFGQTLADPMERACRALIKALYGEDKVMQTLGRRQLDAKVRELGGLNPPPLELALAQQGAVCWLELYHFEQQYAARLNKQPQDSLGFQREEFYQKRVGRAQGRFQQALKALAQVRRLQLPTVQVNISDRQINVGSGQIKVGEAQVNMLVDAGAEE